MNNLLPSKVRIHEKYDLKGSTYKRKASDHERSKSSPTYKDLDFLEKYHLMDRFSKSSTNLHKDHAHNKEDTSTGSTASTNGSGAAANGGGAEYEDTEFGGLLLEAHIYDELINTMQRDCRVLESFEIMDYSMLVGVHNYDRQLKEDNGVPAFDYDDDDQLP